MTQKRTTARSPGVRVVIVTLDSHLGVAVNRVEQTLARELPGLVLNMHAAAEWKEQSNALQRCIADIERADVIIANMLFVQDHIDAITPALLARREHCAALVCCLAEGGVAKLTRMGSLDMNQPSGPALSWLKKLRGKNGNGKPQSAGQSQMAALKRLPQFLKYIPGTAQDLRAYFLTMQYWLMGSDVNIANMVRLLVQRYVADDAAQALQVGAPVDYPEIGVYHPRLKSRVTNSVKDLPRPKNERGRVGLLVMRSYVLAGNTGHYDAVINAFEESGLAVVPIFASGLDQRAAIEQFLLADGVASVDALVSLTGFSLVGGPAYNDSQSAAELLSKLDVPYISAQALEFQSVSEWQASERGLMPIETMMMVALPELDGATGTTVFGGRTDVSGEPIAAIEERVEALAARVSKMIALRKTPSPQRRIAIVIYDFPPNSGATGSAAYLAVLPSLWNFLQALQEQGYAVALPESATALGEQLLTGNSARYGTAANVTGRVTVDTHLKREAHIEDIEAEWGPAPGKLQTDGKDLLVLGLDLGNVFIGVQPAFGYEGDPMRLMFEGGMAPTHAFSAFYGYIKHEFDADAVVHFGTHGALEFMPGKQTGLSSCCWPERLLGSMPNIYLYAANNPSEATIAKRRSLATTVSHLTPAISRAGLFQDLGDLKAIVTRAMDPRCPAAELQSVIATIRSEAVRLELVVDGAEVWQEHGQVLEDIMDTILTVEQTLIPCGLHTLGVPPSQSQRLELLELYAEMREFAFSLEQLAQLDQFAQAGTLDENHALTKLLKKTRRLDEAQQLMEYALGLGTNREIDGLLHALEGGYIAPVPGGDVVRNPEVLPTGRNIHGFDPSRLPSRHAILEGAKQAEQLLTKVAEADQIPATIAMVLWGSDTLKTGGVALGQALALMGARPRIDSYGRLAGAELIPLEELGRARVDVVITISGIFRDLLPQQIRLLAEAAWLCANSDEPAHLNPIRAHSKAFAEKHGVTLKLASSRVFGNAEGAYGANVNHLVDSGNWNDESELGRDVRATALFCIWLRW